MPPPDEGASECWQRQTVRRNTTVSYPLTTEIIQSVTYYNQQTVLWERRVWKPNNRRWAPYSEAEEMRVLDHLIQNTYSFEAEQRERYRLAHMQSW